MALGAADVGLAAADVAAALGALDVFGLEVAAVPPQAPTTNAVASRSAAVRRGKSVTGKNTSSFPVLSTKLLDLVGMLGPVGRLVNVPFGM